jgi:uncharacterized protein DUF2480
MEPIVNRVANSGIQVLDLAGLAQPAPIQILDLQPFLHAGLILREKPFRQAVKAFDWSRFEGAVVAITCSVETIIPTWAYMLVSSVLDGIAAGVTVGSEEDARREEFVAALDRYDWTRHQGRIVVVKGCGNAKVPQAAFVRAMTRLQAVASKVMYGEPCSSVPLWRRPKTQQPA